MTSSNKMPRVLLFSHGELLGDALLKLPALAALRSAFPDHHVTWLAGRGFTLYARQLHAFAERYVDEVREDIIIGQRLLELLQNPLADQHYDIIIDTQHKVRTTLILKQIPHDLFISPTAGFLFSDRKPITDYKRLTVRDRLLRLINLAAGREINSDFSLQLPVVYRTLAEQRLPAGPCYIGLAPGAGGAAKRWPLEKFIELAGRQVAAGRVPVFFLGPDELAWQASIARAVPDALFPEQEPRAESLNGIFICLA
ncbi:MAG: hypothetical protein MI673_09175, partial [Thiotrichales bacterium]|nr:hypothetical protein [Thiotrichales bacterium]